MGAAGHAGNGGITVEQNRLRDEQMSRVTKIYEQEERNTPGKHVDVDNPFMHMAKSMRGDLFVLVS